MRARTLFAAVGLASLVLCGLTASPLAAEPLPKAGVPALPGWSLIPRTQTSIPLGTSLLPAGAPAHLPAADLARHGYVEEEYLIEGRANVYNLDGSEIVKANLPYATRLLIARPADPARWSGDVQIGPFRDQSGKSEVWDNSRFYLIEHGDVWAAFELSGANIATQLQKFDPVRYGKLRIIDDGMRLDMLAQIAWLLRSPDGPLAKSGYPLRRVKVFSSGWSLMGILQITFLRQGHHARARTPEGGPVIDGYLSGINNAVLPTHPTDAAVIRVNSEAEVMRGESARLIRQPDSDLPSDRFRLYEIAGTAHGDAEDAFHRNIAYWQLGQNQAPFACTPPSETRSGKRGFARAAYENLSRWVRDGVAPPPGSAHWIETDAQGHIVKDADGITKGGIRPYWMAVPTGRYVSQLLNAAASPCTVFGYEEALPAERVRALYASRGDYLKKVAATEEALVRGRYLRAVDQAADLTRAGEDVVP